MSNTKYTRYLEAKRTVDERSLNQKVWSGLLDRLNISATLEPLQILEFGAGTGNMLFRILSNLECPKVVYTVLDLEVEHLALLLDKLECWAGYNSGKLKKVGENEVAIICPGREIVVHTIISDVVEYFKMARKDLGQDVIIGQAILDLLDIDALLPLLKASLKKGGLFYFPINFDGMTTFLPSYSNEVDSLVERIYHESMIKAGVDRSHTGRSVLMALTEMGVRVISVGSSDWVVMPDESGCYHGDEKYFLHHILRLVKKELDNSPRINNELALTWYTKRIEQVDKGRLFYIAHQLDILASNR